MPEGGWAQAAAGLGYGNASKWSAFQDDNLGMEKSVYITEAEAEATTQAAYANDMAKEMQQERLKEIKLKLAVEAYERRRPADRIMHHYLIKDAGDSEAVGEYYPTGDERCNAPVYRNQHGLILSREQQPMGPGSDEESYGWVIGHLAERRPLYGVQSDDLSVPTQGWRAFTAPGPMPIVRYFTDVAAAKLYKEKGNTAFQTKDWAEAEDWYGKALACKLDPTEYAEMLGLLFSNRAEVRLRLMNFAGAAGDADSAMKYLRTVPFDEESTIVLKQKTIVRLVKALQGLKLFAEAAKQLREEKTERNPEMERLADELALSIAPPGTGAFSGASSDMLSFVAGTVDFLSQSAGAMGDELSEASFPETFTTSLKKLEYMLAKAKGMKGTCFGDLQRAVRTSGGMVLIQTLVREQWKANLSGKIADTFKLPGAACVASLAGLACEACPENIKLIASEAHAFFGILGGCNCKVDAATCENLISLASGLMQHCKAKTMDLLQSNSVTVERAASFLARAAVAEEEGPADAPAVAAGAREKAVALLYELFATGGRVEKRALRGAVPALAGPSGEGLFTADSAPVRALGESVAYKAISNPSLTTPADVQNLLKGIQLLLVSGPIAEAAEKDVATISYEDIAGRGAKMRYADLSGWETTDDGQHCALLLRLLASALEFRLLIQGRALERDDFEDAFLAGGGYFVVVPFLQAPAAFAEPALKCLAALAQTSADNASTITRLSAIHPLLGMPCPEAKPVSSHVSATLKSSATARKYAAKLLSKFVETSLAMDLLLKAEEKGIAELVKLAWNVYQDGKGNLESFHDMLQVFYVITETRPGPLAQFMTVELMEVLVEMAQAPDDEVASTIVKMLKKDTTSKKLVRPIIKRRKSEGTGDDMEDELLQAKPWFHHV